MTILGTERPRATLGRLLKDVGSTVLELVHGDLYAKGDIGGVLFYDPLDEPVWPTHALVLGVSVSDVTHIVPLLDELGRHECIGLVVRAPVPLDPEVSAAADRSGVAVFGLTKGASWTELVVSLRSLLGQDDVDESSREILSDMAASDLYDLANTVAAILDAPITIEDCSSQVLAYSGRQEEADQARIDTVLHRQVANCHTQLYRERGVFNELYRTDAPIFIESSPDTTAMPRVALAIRAGDQILGSIWAAVRAPLTEERAQAFREAGRLIALHMLSKRAAADFERRLQADLVGIALEGGPKAHEAARRLGLLHQSTVVLALALLDVEDTTAPRNPELVAERLRISESLAGYLAVTTANPRSTAALVGDVAYGIVAITGTLTGATQTAARLANDFLNRTGSEFQVAIGIGSLAEDALGLPRSREGADRALRVVRSYSGLRRIASIDDVSVEASVLELTDLIAARGDPLMGPVARLIDYDTKHGTCLVETLRAWLDAFGDVTAASEAAFVHPNTLRYRLRRVAKVGEIDLSDAEARFRAILQLRLMSRQ